MRRREGAIADGVPVTAKISRFRFDEAAADLITEYRVNNRRSLDELERRIEKHLTPFFGGRRMAAITTADVRAYIAQRQAATETTRKAYTIRRKDGTTIAIPEQRRSTAGPSNAEINRELTILKRMFTLAMQAGTLLHRPHVPMLEERNTRKGFFEPEMLQDVLPCMPKDLQPVIEFAYITGWRIPSEVLTLEWRQVDFKAGEVRLDPETTKNREGRVFPMTDNLRALLEARDAERRRLKLKGQIVPWVFFRMVATRRGGPKEPRPIRAFNKAWAAACLAAGCPGRIPHDLRRTAVRNMVRRGVSERVAMELAGHKTRSIFDRYNIVSAGDLRTAAAQLNGLTGTKKGQSGTLSAASKSESSQIAK
ncbi:MAG TPA: tyrosine-type recombinase/integrase [Pseudolabrys sp.]|nr:tyrosine-type recombinase/integrase [Pseudolabrys sp.]